MIVIVGNPGWRPSDPSGPAGRTCEVGMAAAARGSAVEIVGRAGEDPDGDALMLALARAGIGHVAVLRDPAHATAIVDETPGDDALAADDDGLGPDDDPAGPGAGSPAARPATGGPPLEPADVSLGLHYLTTYRVLVVADDAPSSIGPVATEAATFAGAHLVLLVPPTVAAADLPEAGPAVTVLAAPAEHDEGAFARLVGGYAAALDAGSDPSAAFSAAVSDVGWEALEPSA